MPRFFCENIGENSAVITGEDAKHISKVLRMRVGEELTLCDTKGTDYICSISTISPDEICLDILQRQPSLTEPNVFVKLYQGIPKGDKAEFIIQKAVELGVGEITFFDSSRCVAKIDQKSMDKKITRFQRIAYEAAKQCGRGIIPQIRPVLTFKQAVTEMLACDLPIMLYENSTAPLKQTLSTPAKTISVMVGPEGGFSPEEADFAKSQGCFSLSLGKRILRCETAPIAALAVIMYQTENL